MQRTKPRSGNTHRVVQYKCPKCGRQQGVKYKDGKPISETPVCRRCGTRIMNLDDKTFKRIKGSMAVKAVTT